jgi:putative dimethyl sulfoxide reductase chaperone
MQEQPVAAIAESADMARLLAACYYQPGPEFAEERMFDAMQSAALALDDELSASAQRLAAAFDSASLQELLIDYTRLFLGPNETFALPYGSVWLTGEKSLMQDSTLAVRALYEQAGFEVEDGFRELPDHVAVELEFLYLLKFREAEALHRQDDAALADNAAQRRDFLATHLGRWIGPFTAAMREHAQTSFYRELASLTESFVQREAKAVGAKG